MATSENRGRMAWRRPTVTRMGTADAEAAAMMGMIPDNAYPMMMMSS